MSKADKIFKKMCIDILETGYNDINDDVRTVWSDGKKAHTIKKFGVINRYNLEEEFPILTIRNINWKAAVDELLWIWQKKSNNIKDLNSKIWDQWSDKNGTIGKAYGYQLGIKHKYKEGEFDQVDRVLYDLKNNKGSRRIIANIYNHNDLNEMNLYPCVYGTQFNVQGDKLNCILNQRSQDILVANNWNVVQYSVLVYILAFINNLKPGELIHVIGDAHIYDRHIKIIEKIIENEEYDAPKFKINNIEKDFYKLKIEDFILENYKNCGNIKDIEVAI